MNDDNMKGVLFKNDKQGNENRPDYKGKITVNGVEYWLSAWINESKKDGKRYMALKVQEKEGQPSQQSNSQSGGGSEPEGGGYGNDLDDGDAIPF